MLCVPWQSVQGGRVLLALVGVARAAINRLEFLGMGKLLPGQITVARRAFENGVRRSAQRRLIECGGHAWLPLADSATGFVAVQTRFATGEMFGLLSAQPHRHEDGSGGDSDHKAAPARKIHTICPSRQRV